MKKDCTELVFIMDQSGSMNGLQGDVIGGFNAMIEKQKKQEGEVLVTTVLFNQRWTMVHDRIPISGIPPMTNKDYQPGGCTALLDAVGDTITHILKVHRYIREEDRPEHTIVVITTDGLENASHDWTKGKVKELISEQKDWEFLYLGANIDAAEEAGGIGICSQRAVQYDPTPDGIAASCDKMCEFVSEVRAPKKREDTKKETK
jgi:hypothetical protein